MNNVGHIGLAFVIATCALACQKNEPSDDTHAGKAATTAPTAPAPAKAADAKTGKQLMIGKWKLTKAVMDGTDMTKEMGEGSVMTITESSMTQKVGNSDVTTPITVLKDSSSSVVIKDKNGETTLNFPDPAHLSFEATDQGSKVAMSFVRM